MNCWDIALIIMIAAIVTAAVYSQIKLRKKGKGCCGDCSRCNRRCE